jgi:hypothetical protein
MKKKSTRKNSLSLQRTTIQVLTGAQLVEPAGGIIPVITSDTRRVSAEGDDICN